MPVTNKNRPLLDTPVFQLMTPPPASATVGVSLASDSVRYLYLLVSATSFWRYDTWADAWMQLANTGAGTVGAGTCLQWDSVDNRLWALITSGVGVPVFQYYTPATNAWTTQSVVNLPATFGTTGNMAFPTVASGAASSDFIYLVGNNATVFYRFQISTNAWSTLTATPATMATGCSLVFVPNYNAGGDRIVAMRGGATNTFYYYSISGGTWTALTFKPDTETFTTGSSLCRILTGTPTPRLVIMKDAANRIFELDLSNAAAPSMNMFGTQYLVANGAAVAGSRMDTVVSPDGIEFLYFIPNTTTQMVRTLVLY